MYNIIKLVTLPDSRKFDFCYIIHLDVYLLSSVIISVIVEIWLIKLWWTATSSPICLMSRVSFIIFIICVIQCHKRIVLILMCLIGLHKWPIRLHKRLIWFYYDIAFDILVLTFTMCRCPIPNMSLIPSHLEYQTLYSIWLLLSSWDPCLDQWYPEHLWSALSQVSLLGAQLVCLDVHLALNMWWCRLFKIIRETEFLSVPVLHMPASITFLMLRSLRNLLYDCIRHWDACPWSLL